MKKMMLCALLAVAVACCGTALYAQDNMSQSGGQMAQGGHHMPSPEQRLQHMTKTLNLTADQQTKIKPMLEDEQQKMESLHQDTSMSRQDRMSKMQEIRQSTDEQIKGVLTPEQQTKWQQEMQNHHGGMGHGNMSPPTPQ